MGRHYRGDIEGKFWFGVQSSDDGEFFGAVAVNSEEEIEETGEIEYMIDCDEELGKVADGLKECRKELGAWESWLNEFFKVNDYYNNHDIVAFITYEKKTTTSKDEVKGKLEWFARLELGEKIKEVFKIYPNDNICFSAET